MTTSVASIPAPVLEPILIEDGTTRLRITRVPSSLINTSTGGYKIQRSATHSGFSGASGSDFTTLADTKAQGASTSVLLDLTLSTQTTGQSWYYRAVAYDVLASPTLVSPPSNVVTYLQLADRRVPVPAFPIELEPDQGLLRGLVRSFEDSAQGASATWFQVRTAMARAIEFIEDELRSSLSSVDFCVMLRDPPTPLKKWFEAEAVLLLLDQLALSTEQEKEQRERCMAIATRWRDELYDDDGSVILPGSGTATTGGVRVTR